MRCSRKGAELLLVVWSCDLSAAHLIVRSDIPVSFRFTPYRSLFQSVRGGGVGLSEQQTVQALFQFDVTAEM